MNDASRSLLTRVATGLVAAYVGFTASWITLCLLNTGDAFPQGPARVLLPILGVVPILSAWIAIRLAGRTTRTVLIAAALLAAAFWGFVPDGWWAVEPPVQGPHVARPLPAE